MKTLIKQISRSPRIRGDILWWSLGLKQHVSPKVMITVTRSFMLRGSIHRQHVNWQRLMWRGGGPARLLTGEIIANKGTPLCVIDRLQGRPPPARKPCFMDRDSVQIQTHAYAQTCTFICMYTCTHTQTFTLLTGCSLFKECSQLFGYSSATHDQIRSLFLKLI